MAKEMNMVLADMFSVENVIGLGATCTSCHQARVERHEAKVAGLARVPQRFSNKPGSAGRSGQDDSGDSASREPFNHHECLRKVGSGRRDGRNEGAGGVMQPTCNHGAEPGRRGDVRQCASY